MNENSNDIDNGNLKNKKDEEGLEKSVSIGRAKNWSDEELEESSAIPLGCG